MSKWLDVVGVTAKGLASLNDEHQKLVDDAEIVVGPPRSLPKLRGDDPRYVEWQAPLDKMIAQILSYRGKNTVVLATGDPTWYGIGATLTRYIPLEEFEIHPAPSAFSLAAARMKWPLQNTACVSVHGRPIELLNAHIVPGNRILALTSDATAIKAIANLLQQRKFGQSHMTILNAMGGDTESRIDFTANTYQSQGIGNLNTLAIDCVADEDAALLPPLPGLPDSAFVSDGQLTKREVRAATLAKLVPLVGQHLWDIGAGSGSIGIEWMRAAPRATATAFEKSAQRIEMIKKNRDALGTPGLSLVEGDALAQLDHAPQRPDAIFMGGDVGNAALFDALWAALKPGGRFVANAVTLDGEGQLLARLDQKGGDLARIDVAHLDHVGAHKVLRPKMTVTQWAIVKKAAE